MIRPPAGVCQVCGCTEERRCRLDAGEECVWLNRSRNVCNNRHCVVEYDRKRKAARKPKVHPWKVIARDPRTGRATRIVKRRDLKKGYVA